MTTLEEIFSNTKVDPATGCRLWLLHLDSEGYGQMWWQGKSHAVHRVVWELVHGNPGSLDVLHTCDTKPCCEPTHLFLGTDLDNARDCVAKGRRPRGEQNGSHKLTEAQVVEIKRLLVEGKHTKTWIASTYGVHLSTILSIAQNRTWKHVSWPAKEDHL